jgi:hypothetical protein
MIKVSRLLVASIVEMKGPLHGLPLDLHPDLPKGPRRDRLSNSPTLSIALGSDTFKRLSLPAMVIRERTVV